MMSAPRSAAHLMTAGRFPADSTEPVGHWCAGVRITASALLSRSLSIRIPFSSTGTPTTSSPAASAAGNASSPEDGSSSAIRFAPAAASTLISSVMPCAYPVQITM
jgi:hypothetical protein